jgi:hypothetical protein
MAECFNGEGVRNLLSMSTLSRANPRALKRLVKDNPLYLREERQASDHLQGLGL